MPSTRLRHPLLRLDVIAADGSRSSERRVYCLRNSQSVDLETCSRCAYCDAIRDGNRPSVDCTVPKRPVDHAHDPGGERVGVGALLCRGTVVLSTDVAAPDAFAFLRAHNLRSVAVVDERHVLRGVVHEARSLVRAPSLSNAISTAKAVHESTPIRVALKVLAANHLREIAVVTTARVPLGVFRDVDGLRWISAPFGEEEPE